mmetsp:Transcript_105120/g.307205  ORF Transcript_105120/g.307205 Transcript_105120/m.307205 type:complete len:523 (-) Transcript_105120:249-1817(-)
MAEAVDVVVVGGGVAGIASAVSLAQRGLKVKLVESRPELGGRARSWVDSVTKDPVHIGPHVVVTEYPNFFKLLEMLGTRGKLAWQPPRHFLTWVKGQQEYHLRTAPLPAPFSWGPAAILDPLVPSKDSQSMLYAIIRCLSLDEEGVMKLDSESGAEFLRRSGVSEAYIQHFWAFCSHAILNVPIEEVSAAALVRFFRYLISRPNMEMGFSDCGLGELVTPARDLLTKLGASVLMGTEVVEFLGDAEQCTGVKLEDGSIVEAKMGVISTLPPQTLLPLLQPAWVEKHETIRNLQHLKPCKYICVYIWFDRKVTGGRMMWARTYNKKDLNCEFYDFSEIYSGSDAKGVSWRSRPSFVGSNVIDSARVGEMSDEDLLEGTLREMEEFFTDVRQAKVVHWRVNRVPMAIHRPVVGTECLRPDQASPVAGLYFGGCWTRTLFPGSMESAARGGFLAAERLLERRGMGKEGDISLAYTETPLVGRLIGKLEYFPLLQRMLFGTLSVCTPPFFGVVSRMMGNTPPQSRL